MPVRTRSGHTTSNHPTDESSSGNTTSAPAPESNLPAPTRKKRVVTSDIPGLSIAEVRKGLDQVRQSWAARDEEAFHPHTMLIQTYGMTAQEFCLRFVLGQHLKRFAKSKSRSSR